MLRPPYAAKTLMFRISASLLASSVICKANSRVGVIIKACVASISGEIFSKSGSKNANVFPVPVWA